MPVRLWIKSHIHFQYSILFMISMFCMVLYSTYYLLQYVLYFAYRIRRRRALATLKSLEGSRTGTLRGGRSPPLPVIPPRPMWIQVLKRHERTQGLDVEIIRLYERGERLWLEGRGPRNVLWRRFETVFGARFSRGGRAIRFCMMSRHMGDAHRGIKEARPTPTSGCLLSVSHVFTLKETSTRYSEQIARAEHAESHPSMYCTTCILDMPRTMCVQ
ncbi:uncharacterized protein EV422DRAFT_23569 [Fimicolochytrium jonesii]|uniref:uncharacterized protein n=1 Tax=Fimicolochytrium jonesii TaxID=1396493 RepID=UPI0022FDEA4E|nr:uncharacterized protein EV422DRAFT_23569 [Fimicolochytrium jonesii]KAI8827053.1 hypothetical protein EV422DRAFT_23569 [Fimicolochytrium jonesii]